MKLRTLNPNEIITTKDFPVHNEHILKIYFKVCKKDPLILPPTPVMPLSVELPLLKPSEKGAKEYNQRFKEYLKKNKKVKYVMLDGSHKTTALALTHNKIHSVIVKTDADIKEIKTLVELGEVFSLAVEDSVKEEIKGIAKHLKDAEFFETIEDKTKRMVEMKVIPKFMIKEWNRE